MMTPAFHRGAGRSHGGVARPAGRVGTRRGRPNGPPILPLLAMLLLSLLAAVASAQSGGAAAARVDLDASRVYVFVGRTGLGHDHAIVGRLESGEIRLGAAKDAGRLVFAMRSFLADTPEARRAMGLEGEPDERTRRQTTATMLGPDVLDVARHPTATLEIRSALPSGRDSATGRPLVELAGRFTLHGVTREVVIPAEVETARTGVRLAGAFRIRQSDFGIEPQRRFGGVVGVADELTIEGEIHLAATAAAEPPATTPGLAPVKPTARPPAGRLPPEELAPQSRGGAR